MSKKRERKSNDHGSGIPPGAVAADQSRQVVPGNSYYPPVKPYYVDIEFTCCDCGRREVWKIPSAGGEPLQVTHSGGGFARESWDGEFLYFTKSEEDPWLWRMPLPGGEETQVVKVHQGRNWDLNRLGIFSREVESRVRWQKIVFFHYDPDTGQRRELFSREGSISQAIHALSVSADGSRFLFSETTTSTTELMLVENFR